MEPVVMENQSWISRWDNRAIGFHKEDIHPTLLKHASSLLGGRSNIRIFVPLCGKSLDMKWFYDQGHTVIGVEVAERAIGEFFEEQKMAFFKTPVPAVDGTVFQSEDKRCQIYCCDFFNISKDIIGQVDAIWDRGALVAINVGDRARYASVMIPLMAPGCRYLLSALEYDETKYGGPPHHLAQEAVQEIFGEKCTLEILDNQDIIEERQKSWGIDSLFEKVHLILLKNK